MHSGGLGFGLRFCFSNEPLVEANALVHRTHSEEQGLPLQFSLTGTGMTTLQGPKT